MSDAHVRIDDTAPWIAHLGDGAATAFAAPFAFFDAADLAVWADGDIQALDVDYTVSGAGESAGGTVTFAGAPEAGVAVVIARRTPVERTSDFLPGGALRADVLNTELDRLTAIAQDIRAGLGRAVRLPDHDSEAPLQAAPAKSALANRLLAFDADGEPVAGPLSGSLQQVENVGVLEAQAAASAASAEASAAAAAEDADGIAALVQNVPAASSFTGDGATADFALSATPVDALALLVTVDGAVQHPPAYGVAGATLSFATPPALDATVEVRDLSATAIVDAADVSAAAAVSGEIATVAADIDAVSEVAAAMATTGEAARVAALADFLRRHPDVQTPSLLLAPRLGHGLGLVDCIRDGTATTVDAGRRLKTVAADAPRLWHDPETGRPLYILKEEAATNLCLQSEALNQTPWTGAGVAVSEVASGPRSPADGDYFTLGDADAGSGLEYRQDIDVSQLAAGEPVVVSGWLRRETGNGLPALRVRVLDDAATPNTLLDCALLPFGDPGSELSDAGAAVLDHGLTAWPDGWVHGFLKIALPDPGAQALDLLRLSLHPAWNADSADTAADAATTGTAGFWGLQAERGHRASSYVPTAGAQATRPPDVLTAPVAASLARGAMTVMVRYRYLGEDRGGSVYAHPASIGDPADGSDEYLGFRHRQASATSPHVVSAISETAGSIDALGTGAARTEGASVAVAAGLAGGASTYEVDGESELDAATPGALDPDRLTHLIVGAAPSAGWDTHNNIGLEEAAFWPVKLADADLTEVTGP